MKKLALEVFKKTGQTWKEEKDYGSRILWINEYEKHFNNVKI